MFLNPFVESVHYNIVHIYDAVFTQYKNNYNQYTTVMSSDCKRNQYPADGVIAMCCLNISILAFQYCKNVPMP